jgi:GAF domain-containing protein
MNPLAANPDATLSDPRYKLLCEIGYQLTAETRLGELLARIVAAAAEVLGARASSLMLVAQNGRELIFQVAYGEKGAQLQGMRLPIDEQTIAGWVARHGQPLNTNDAQRHPAFSGVVDRALGFETRGLVCVPLRRKERVIGVIEVLNRADDGPFTADDLELLLALAGNAAVAIENARLLKATRRRLRRLQATYTGTMQALTALLTLARALGFADPERLRALEYGALLHDVGKIGVADAILRKPGLYTAEERAEMQKHPLLGYTMLQGIAFLRPALGIVRHHHERWDGTGYPDRLAGAAIPLEARIFAVADVFDALTSQRPYHHGHTYAEAHAYISENRGAHFDPAVVDAFCAIPESEWEMLRERVAAGEG